MILQCITILNPCKILKKNICLKMPVNKKFFFYYCRISVKEGLHTKLFDAQLEMDNFKDLYQRCRLCCCVIKIKKAFKEKEDICKLCFKLLEIQDIRDAINPKIYVFFER